MNILHEQHYTITTPNSIDTACSYLIPVGHLEADGSLQLAQTDGAEVEGPSVRLLRMVRALHHTLHPLAVLDPQYVAQLMAHGLKNRHRALSYLVLLHEAHCSVPSTLF